ncbi:protein takeout [Leptinotarsa decemlineata]|uniref:protein takeout n=1 Tax=Leptinotarsa decemlineata TaxID=7539 RepID=UPI003D30624A
MWRLCSVIGFTFAFVVGEDVPPYIKQCHKGDPEVIECFKEAIHHLRPYLKKGIKEIELPSVEPFKMEELSLSLTTGPNGYKVSLKNIDVFGASQFTVRTLKLSTDKQPFETKIKIPLLKIESRYESSGVLIILPASGNGTFNGHLDDILATVRGTVSVQVKEKKKYLHVDTLTVDLDVKDVGLEVKNIYKNNIILTQAINLFLRQNGMEVFNVMLPQLKLKLAGLFMSICNSLLSHIPMDTFYVPEEGIKK